MQVEQNILRYIRLNKINVARLAAETGLRQELFSEKSHTEWEADELLRICTYLEVDPRRFAEERPDRKKH